MNNIVSQTWKLAKEKRECLIVSVGEFGKRNSKNRRLNHEQDAKRMEKTFSELNFKCTLMIGWVTLKEVKDKISLLLQDQTGKDMFWLVFGIAC